MFPHLHSHAREPRASNQLFRKFWREVAELDGADRAPEERIHAEVLASLPEPAQRMMKFAGIVGTEPVWSLRARWYGRFRLEERQPWLDCEAWHYDLASPLTRIFHMRLRMAGVLPVLVRDCYVGGHGRTLARALDAFPVADDTSEETAIGQLVTYLNDAVLLAPSLLLGPHVSIQSAGEDSFEVALRDSGRRVSASVEVDHMGRVTQFFTNDRFMRDPARPERMRRTAWSTPVHGWQYVKGRMLPTRADAVWHVPGGGDFCYAEFHLSPAELALNVAPES
jgi:hypothetical protein